MNECGLPGTLYGAPAKHFPAVSRFDRRRVFGSYANGRVAPRSDIDLAALRLTDRRQVGRMSLDQEDHPVPQKCDVQAYKGISSEHLKSHTDHYRITIYQEFGE